jgi:chlorophyll(ide) b reductase
MDACNVQFFFVPVLTENTQCDSSGASLQNKKMFNIICEQPETVARALVPNLRTVKGTGKAVNYLTPPRIVLAFVNAWFRRGRWFDEEVCDS